MKNIAIVCDSSVALNPELVKEYNVVVAPLTLIHNNKEYKDQIDKTSDDVNDLLRNKEKLQTSQPNLGLLIEIMEDIKSQNFDHVFILSLTSSLSGTYSSFNNAIQEVGLENYTLVDSRSLAGPIQHMVKAVRTLNAEGKSIEEIEAKIDTIVKNTVSYVYPQTLDQLKVSGRISKTAALMASVLKVKPLLFLENNGETIEKMGTARTETKIFEMIVDGLVSNGVAPDTHDIYYLESEGKEILARFDAFLTEKLGSFDTSISTLPAVVAAHAGIGTTVVQWVEKI